MAPACLTLSSANAAPEVISAKTHYDGTKADIWSCGVMLYVMLFCEYPFERPEDEQDKYGFQKVLDRIMRLDYKIPRHPRISTECRDLIQGILEGDPERRLNIEAIQRHPWWGSCSPLS
jgi:serine/threonine-protein kinase SRK2